MIRRSRRGAALAVACLLLAPALGRANPLDIPAAAPPQFRALLRARLHSSKRPPVAESRVELESQHGYRLAVIGEGGIVALVATRGRKLMDVPTGSAKPRSRVVTGYVTHGTVTPTRIEGSFGRFGSVAVRFRPSGRIATEDPRRCRGHDHFVFRYGAFVGRIRFTGENRYIAVRAHRAKGRIRSPLYLHCLHRHITKPIAHNARPVGGPARSRFAAIFAEHRRATASTELLAFRVKERALLLALVEESLGRVAELRYALAVAPGAALVHNDALTSATLDPPAPFHGKGFYGAAPDGTKTWTGSLSVAFPGAARQPLAGSEFEADLVAGF